MCFVHESKSINNDLYESLVGLLFKVAIASLRCACGHCTSRNTASAIIVTVHSLYDVACLIAMAMAMAK